MLARQYSCGAILFLSALLYFEVGASPLTAQSTVTLDMLLIHASDRPAALDTRLDRVEFRLRRIFGFEHYGFLQQQRTLMTLPTSTRLQLVTGHVVQIQAERRDGRIRAHIEWFEKRERLLATSITQRRGVPAILGGPPHDEGSLILVLEFE